MNDLGDMEENFFVNIQSLDETIPTLERTDLTLKDQIDTQIFIFVKIIYFTERTLRNSYFQFILFYDAAESSESILKFPITH